MDRRKFLAALSIFGGATSVVAVAAETSPSQPYTESAAQCPHCGCWMLIVSKRWKQPRHDSGAVWSCGQCRLSWHIRPERLNAVAVPFDDAGGKL